jgi:hypothetical protein
MNVGGYPVGWKLVVEEGSSSGGRMPAFNLGRARQLHQRMLGAYQCTSTLVKHIDAPVELVRLRFAIANSSSFFLYFSILSSNLLL